MQFYRLFCRLLPFGSAADWGNGRYFKGLALTLYSATTLFWVTTTETDKRLWQFCQEMVPANAQAKLRTCKIFGWTLALAS